jgi:hypothetical protein
MNTHCAFKDSDFVLALGTAISALTNPQTLAA